MKKIVCYFDNTALKIFNEKIEEDGKKKLVLSSPHNFVSAAEIVARVIDIDDDTQIPTRIDPNFKYYNVVNYVALKASQGIYFDEQAKAYKASEFGFVVFKDGRLQLLSLLTITRDKLKAYYTLFPTKFGKIPNFNDIQEILHEQHILAGVGRKNIDAQLSKIDIMKPRISRIIVAKSKEPVDGHEEYYIPLIDIDKKAGEIKSDGSMDFKEVGSIIQIKKNQKILKRVPEVKAVDGFDIYGDKVISEVLDHDGFKKGQNIVQSGEDENIYISSLDGCLETENKTISILPVAYIKGDVNYDTGNIDFNGSVHVSGSVLPGFTVKATGDITIEKTVEDGYIEAGGDITVKGGVVGKERVRVISSGSITAKYLLNAKVESTDEIIVEDSIINCDVFSNNKISVIAKHGKIIGGKSTALYEIIVNVAGAINETTTTLNVGRNLFIEKELMEVRKLIDDQREVVTEVMRKLRVGFGEGVFEDPKKYIAILPAVKKKNCLLLLKELSNGNKTLKELTEKSKEIASRLKLDREPVIIVNERVNPGVVLNIKKSVRKIEKPSDNVKFFEDPETKTIRFTSAV